ncbi:MarC family protein [Cyanobium sp. NIES-981]|uniref:MarC family protein n=1 Tax=Cyanobium sp. NIES-981 TaxID=1851505 RepID=UPI0007DCD6AA|nr:MarC family protein [Cyanobium sp. NIES-981]SBO43678.1 putative membrane efflux protein [Cyanobium sp. NIES-981]
MEDLNRYVITLLALINPLICALMLRQCTEGASRQERLRGVGNVVLRTGLILVLSAALGPRLLHTLGISLDVFRIVGGAVIALIGYGMFQSPQGQPPASQSSSPLDPIVIFAASPGTVATVITLSVMRGPEEGPLLAVAAVAIALAITAVVMAALVLRPGRAGGASSSLVTRFLGLILIAMGLQFVLTNLRAFFRAA